MMGGTYCALFEMDENGVCNKAQEKHIKKAELISAITVIAGLASGRPGVVGTGMLASARTYMYTSFDSVKELEILPKQHLIRLNGTLDRNQVYAERDIRSKPGVCGRGRLCVCGGFYSSALP